MALNVVRSSVFFHLFVLMLAGFVAMGVAMAMFVGLAILAFVMS